MWSTTLLQSLPALSNGSSTYVGTQVNLLVLGSGGREHAICWKLSQSPLVDKLYCTPGNPGTAAHAKPLKTDVWDFEGLVKVATALVIDLVIVGPEDLLAAGIADILNDAGIKCLGPVAAAARIESSKAWAKKLMTEARIPTAAFEVADHPEVALEIVERAEFPIVIKADGLALGKGVTVASSASQARQAIKSLMVDCEFGEAGKSLVIEECMVGEEFSAFAISDGQSLKMLPFARDFKRVFDNDEGPNTGSMGCYSPVGIVNPQLAEQVEDTIMTPTLAALRDRGTPYVGILYAGLMLTKEGPRVVEFNCRFGDPEAQAILPLMDCDLAELALRATEGTLSSTNIQITNEASCCVVAASGGYPGEYTIGHKIEGLAEAETFGLVFHAGTSQRRGILETAGGRVLSVVGRGANLRNAHIRAYKGISRIAFIDSHYRTDIGTIDSERMSN